MIHKATPTVHMKFSSCNFIYKPYSIFKVLRFTRSPPELRRLVVGTPIAGRELTMCSPRLSPRSPIFQTALNRLAALRGRHPLVDERSPWRVRTLGDSLPNRPLSPAGSGFDPPTIRRLLSAHRYHRAHPFGSRCGSSALEVLQGN